MRILVSGASGLIGKSFIRQALAEGHEIFALVRNPSSFKLLPAKNLIRWSDQTPLDPASLDGMDAILHLAGENIADKRWTKARKLRLVDSRIKGTRSIVETLRKIPAARRPKTFLSGSAIGYYGYQREEPLDESSTAGSDFLAELCVNWEEEALKAKDLLRVVLVRTGIVLSRAGGALPKMPPIQLSNGKGWMSWIHIEDMVRALLFALDTKDLEGPVNFTSPQAVTNKEFTKALAKAYRIPALGFTPAFALKIALGELANALLSSQKVMPRALQEKGFSFRYPSLDSALARELNGIHFLDKAFVRDQFVPKTREEVFSLFSSAENLETLTPPWLNFRIISKTTDKIQKGTLIDYRLRIHGAPVRWRTLISEWKPEDHFVDEQLKGPYSKWRHLHTFRKVPGGCIIGDEVIYRVPGSFLGAALLSAWIAKDVSQIFSYRQKRIEEMFGE
jgi:uncharacterized protein